MAAAARSDSSAERLNRLRAAEGMRRNDQGGAALVYALADKNDCCSIDPAAITSEQQTFLARIHRGQGR